MKVLPVNNYQTHNKEQNPSFNAFRIDCEETLSGIKKLEHCSLLSDVVQYQKGLSAEGGIPNLSGYLTAPEINALRKYSDVYVTFKDFNKAMEVENCHVGNVFKKLKNLAENAKLITKEQINSYLPKIENSRKQTQELEMEAKAELGLR